MAASVSFFVPSEVGFVDTSRRFSFLTRLRQCAFISVLWMVSGIDVAAEIARAMKPWTRTYEDIARKPLRAVVSRRRAAIGGDVIVTVGTFRGDTNSDADLRLCIPRRCGATDPHYRR